MRTVGKDAPCLQREVFWVPYSYLSLQIHLNPLPLSHLNSLSNHVPTKMSTDCPISFFPFSDHFISSLVLVLFLIDDLIPALLDSETVLESQASLSQGLWLEFTPLACHTMGYLK